jgi:exportin-5
MTEALQTFQGFCRLLGLDRVQEYLTSRRVHEIPDFSKHPLDPEGQALQNELTEKFKVSQPLFHLELFTDLLLQALPIRATKAFIAVSTEKLKRPSNAYNISCSLWHDAIPMILPNLLKFMRLAAPGLRSTSY